ncbi:MAG: hypothetical protein GWN67_27280 [Phycisphaerae bacterium]|nr:hypothetical protein [Phycisphaerae bacterium]NIP55845.1 hypothetical protein [Phycisphaerae bacterium]NIS54437.1 hypothetical protein [Phycisphaerae bacterium]NIU12075.1 hypothetical protein [Phycisphaerae bacterium]NIU59930.1 hypothetical protein [Phycisphaerae bacterium]
MKKREIVAIVVVLLGLMAFMAGPAQTVAMETAFTYQGRLMDANAPADGTYDFQFRLYNTNDPCVGNQQGSTVEVNDLDVINGYFTAELDFGSDVFNGDRIWLGIVVRPGDSDGVYTNLLPRQEVTPTPYSLHSRGIFVDDSGKVGIGTDSPLNNLHIYDTVNAYVLTEGDGGYAFFIADGYRNSGLTIRENSTTKANIYWNTASQCLSLAGGGGDHLVVKDEKVGIGTSSPSAKLEVNGAIKISPDSQSKLRVGRYSSSYPVAYINAEDADQMRFQIGNHTQMVIDTSGNVCIGAENPQNDLHIYDSTHCYVDAESETGYAFFQADGHKNSGLTIKEDGINKAHVYWDTANASLNLSEGGGDRLVVKGGNVGIGTSSPAVKLDVAGMARCEVIQITGADVAEKFPVSEEVKPGMVVTIDTENQGQLCLSRGAYNRCVAGVVSGAKGLPAGAILGNLPGHEDAVPIALSGRVWVYCDTAEKAIAPGDMLTTSPKAGHAMAVTDYTKAHGAVLGKAMTSLEQGQTGLVLTLINLQ